MAGCLFVVATPIGNLADISLRALDILRQVKLILAEDTRHSGILLHHYGINTPTQSLHKYNESGKIDYIAEQLTAGRDLALISDAGTPLISDPGANLVAQLRARGFTVCAVPGASALIAALSIAGLSTERFIFEGFLPAKAAARRTQLLALKMESRTLVFYEAPHRLIATLTDFQEVFGKTRQMALVKELTKQFETVRLATIAENIAWLQENAQHLRGEFVLIIAGNTQQSDQQQEAGLRAARLLAEELPLKQAAAFAAKLTDCPKNWLYQQLLLER